jgi:aldehyde dehydrogenase (NAD+)
VVTIGKARPDGPSIIPQPKVGAYPPALTPSASEDGSSTYEPHYLPPRQICDYYISRFLEDVHCTYWFYSIESFLGRVEMTYADLGRDASSSWMCSLYAIFALGASSYSEEQHRYQVAGASPLSRDEKSAMDYISLAKQLIPAVYDEADIDSIRALAILVNVYFYT